MPSSRSIFQCRTAYQISPVSALRTLRSPYRTCRALETSGTRKSFKLTKKYCKYPLSYIENPTKPPLIHTKIPLITQNEPDRVCQGARPRLASPSFFATLASVTNMTNKPNPTHPVPLPSSAPKERTSHSPGRSLRSPGSGAPESRALKVRPKNPNHLFTYTRTGHVLLPIKSQGATIGGPLKTRGPLRNSQPPSLLLQKPKGLRGS